MELTTGAIFLAGLATFASPCVLPMIPIYLSVLMGGSLGEEEITGRARDDERQAVSERRRSALQLDQCLDQELDALLT